MTTRLIAGVLAAAWCALAPAQTVYESKDKAGPVFSDRPSPGAKPVDLAPPNVVQQQPVPAQAPAPAPAFAYRSISIALPEGGDTVHSNTGGFGLTVKVSPALRVRAGDRIRLRLDGNLLPKAYTSGKIAITDAEWLSAAGSTNAKHSLQAAVVDKTGAVQVDSAVVSFFARRATVQRDAR